MALMDRLCNLKYTEKMSGRDFEFYCANYLNNRGFWCEVYKGVADGGIDIMAVRAFKTIVQCKHYAGNVSPNVIRDLIGTMKIHRVRHGMLMTTGRVSRATQALAKRHRIKIIDPRY